jgi:hypothetical protein
LTVTDGNRSATSTLQLTFTANPALPVIVSSSSALLIPNQPFYYKLEADAADSSTTYRLLFALPNGLSFNPATREITGTYIVPLAPDRVFPNPPAQSGGIITNVQLFANNSNGTGTLPLIFFPAATGAVNIATRVAVGTGSEVLIGGFIVTGEAAAKKLLIRAIGPSLGDFGVPNPLQDPKLELRDGAGSLIASNDDWRSDQETQIIATTIAPTDNRESALLAYLSPEHSDTPNSGHYTAIVSGKNNGTGNALVEVYDLGTATLDSSTAKLANISTRGKVGINDDVMIGGFITSGTPTAVVARAIGPSLEPFGIVDPLADPSLELRDVNGVLIIRNDNWRGPQEQQLIDLGLAPTDNRESAVIATLNPGNYTGTVRGENNTTGVAVVEVYVLK